jgi:hypothetical protein
VKRVDVAVILLSIVHEPSAVSEQRQSGEEGCCSIGGYQALPDRIEESFKKGAYFEWEGKVTPQRVVFDFFIF